MRRRQALGALAAGVTAAGAGCLSASFTRHTQFTLERTDLSTLVAEITAVDSLGRDRKSALERSARRGVVIPDNETLPRYARVEDRYYRIDDVSTVVEVDGDQYQAAGPSWPVLVVEPTDGGANAVALDSYPDDVARFVASVTDQSATRRRPLPPGLDESSQLTPGPQHPVVTHDGQQYRLAITDRETREEFGLVRVRLVADSTAAFETYFDEEVLDIEPMVPSEFSAKQRAILRRAIDYQYEEEGSLTDAYQTVLDAVSRSGDWYDTRTLEGESEGPPGETVAVVYDDDMYRATTAKKTIVSEF